jgi:hypothetical protein
MGASAEADSAAGQLMITIGIAVCIAAVLQLSRACYRRAPNLAVVSSIHVAFLERTQRIRDCQRALSVLPPSYRCLNPTFQH